MIPTVRPNRAAGAGVLTGALLLVALAAGAHPVAAQATLRGRVVDSETGQPIAQATLTVGRGPPRATTDSLGRFELAGLAAGNARLTIQRVGYATGEFELRVPDGGVVDRNFSLDFSGARLPEVVVKARAEELMPRYVDFERRRQLGMGAFLRWDELANGRFGSVGDALRSIRGVRIQCNQQTYECFAVMVRTPQCHPTWFIDGTEAGSFHENTPIRDVYGIEIYRGPGEVPGEFSGSSAACGVIVMWTKSRPFRE